MTFERIAISLARQLGRPLAVGVTSAGIVACTLAAMVSAWRDAVLLWSGAATGWLSLIYLSILQNSQNREAAATQAKFDELLHATQGARDELIGLEERSAEEIAVLRQRRPS